jgi:hypothetical protein
VSFFHLFLQEILGFTNAGAIPSEDALLAEQPLEIDDLKRAQQDRNWFANFARQFVGKSTLRTRAHSL